jgi:hypothetical protein
VGHDLDAGLPARRQGVQSVLESETHFASKVACQAFLDAHTAMIPNYTRGFFKLDLDAPIKVVKAECVPEDRGA